MNTDLDQALKSLLQGLNFIETGANFADDQLVIMPEVAAALDGVDAILKSGDRSALARLERSLQSHPRRVELFGDLLTAAETAMRYDLHHLVEAAAGVPDEFDNEMFESLNDLGAHWPPELKPELLVLAGPVAGAGRIGVQIIVKPANLDQPLLWDHIEATVAQPQLALALMSYVHDSLRVMPELRAAPRAPTPPLYRYHPERFQAYHPYVKEVLVSHEGASPDRNRSPSVDELSLALQLVSLTYNHQISQVPLRQRRDEPPQSSKALSSIAGLAMGVARFVRFGRQIFDLPPSMVEMFRHTDVDDVPLDLLNVPYGAFYIHFGKTDLELAPGHKIDGAYVHRTDDGVFGITMTTVPDDPLRAEQWSIYGEPEYTQQFAHEHRGMTVGLAVDSVLSQTLDGLRRRRDSERPPLGADQLDELGLKPSSVSWVGAETAIKQLDELPQQTEAYRAALRLVINAICYLTAYRDDVEKGWAEGTPKSLVAKAGRPGKEGQRAKSKLEALGYRAIHRCGVRFEAQAAARGSIGTTRDRGWVMGHWKRQVHGVGRALRKLIWVMPYMTHRNEDGPEPLGHLYLCS